MRYIIGIAKAFCPIFEATILTSAKDSSTLSCFLSRYDEDTTLLCDGKDADCGMSVRGSF